MNNILIPLFVGVIISELAGLLMIILGRRSKNLTIFITIGIFVCAIGIGSLIFGVIGVWVLTHN